MFGLHHREPVFICLETLQKEQVALFKKVVCLMSILASHFATISCETSSLLLLVSFQAEHFFPRKQVWWPTSLFQKWFHFKFSRLATHEPSL